MRKKTKQDIPVFIPPDQHEQRTIWITGRWAFCSFPYDRYINDIVTTLPGRAWVPETKLWAVPLDSVAAIRGIEQLHYEHGFGFGAGAGAALGAIKEQFRLTATGTLLDNPQGGGV